jgi:RimJ/RimL family protein N-acetyltransferase
MIRRWLGQPEVVRWWGPRATTEAEVLLAMATPQAICRVIEVSSDPGAANGGRSSPVGYAHAIDAGLAGPPRLDVLPPGTWQIDVFVASAKHRGRGIGGVALTEMRDEVFQTTLAVAAAAFVAVGNEKAVRAYEQAGFKWRAIARDADRGAEWLMLAERPADLPFRFPRPDGVPRLL